MRRLSTGAGAGRAARARGFTLVEVLITIVVTAIGLLTVAGLQAASKRVSYESAQRTAAIALAQDMVERIRANPGARASYLTASLANQDATSATLGTDCAATTCTSTELAAYDVYLWGQKLLGVEEKSGTTAAGGLLDPTGCIRQTGSIYRVVVAWRGFRGSDAIASTDALYDACGTGLDRYTDPGNSNTNDDLRRFIFIEFL